MEREKRDDLFPVFDFIGAAAGHDDFPQWTVGELLQYVRHQFFCPRNRGSSFDFVSEMHGKFARKALPLPIDAETSYVTWKAAAFRFV